MLGTVSGYPTRREAQALLDERLRAVNAGASRPEASIAFGTFVEEQWKALVLPTFKASTQHGYKTILNAHVLPVWRDCDSATSSASRLSKSSADKFRQGTGWQTVRNGWVRLSSILETAVEYGYLQANPARGVKFRQKGLKEKPAIITGRGSGEVAQASGGAVSDDGGLIAATGLRIGEAS